MSIASGKPAVCRVVADPRFEPRQPERAFGGTLKGGQVQVATRGHHTFLLPAARLFRSKRLRHNNTEAGSHLQAVFSRRLFRGV